MKYMERQEIRHLTSENIEREVSMLSYGFILDSEFNVFIKPEFGMFLTNTDELDNLDYLEKMKDKPFYSELLDEGCELVLGPPAPAINGKFYSKNGVYIVNYKDILRKRREERAKKETEMQIGLTDDDIDTIVRTFKGIINDYKIALMHSSFGINLMDSVVDSIYKYEKEICEKYKNEELYKIISSLKSSLNGDDACKTHIIYTLENNLFDQVFENNSSSPSEDTLSLIAQAIVYINGYDTIQSHTRMGLNLNSENDNAINNIYDFIASCDERSMEEKCAIINGIRKHYIDKKASYPESAVTIINSLMDSIFDEKFNQDKEKNVSPK